MSPKQLTLFDVKPDYTDYQARKWTKKYIEYYTRIYQERGDSTGEYCCGCHWCCDECDGGVDCVHTIKNIARKLGIKINYSDFDFGKQERLICEAYEKNK